MPEICVIQNFVKVVREILDIYDSCDHGQTKRQTDNPIFYKVENYLDRLHVPEICVIPNFVKIVWVVLEIYESYIHRQTDREPDILHNWDLSRSSSCGRNVCNKKFCENLLSSSRDLRDLRSRTERQTDRQPDFLQGCDLSNSSSRARNMYITEFWENR